jgi:hypothetical protein
MIAADDTVPWGEIIFNTLAVMAVGFAVGMVVWFVWAALTRTTANRLRNNTLSRDYGHITQAKADSLSEKQARRIYGDAEVDRFLKHGDWNEHYNRVYRSIDPMDDSVANSPETSGGLARIYPAFPPKER